VPDFHEEQLMKFAVLLIAAALISPAFADDNPAPANVPSAHMRDGGVRSHMRKRYLRKKRVHPHAAMARTAHASPEAPEVVQP
jgi:hypothetical protein